MNTRSDLDNLNLRFEQNRMKRGFLEYACATALVGTDSDHGTAEAILERKFGPRCAGLEYRQKTAVTALDSSSDLAVANQSNTYMEGIRPKTIIGQLLGRLEVPANVNVPVTGDDHVYSRWLAENAPMPVSRLDLDFAPVGVTKLGIALVLSKELFRQPNAVTVFDRILQTKVIRGDNAALLSNNPAVENQNPAGLLYGLTPVTTGSPSDLTPADFLLAYRLLRNGHPIAAYIIASPHAAFWLALQRDTNGPVFPNINATTGGNIGGVPVILAPEAMNHIVFIDAAALAVFDGGLLLERSVNASVQMSDSPSNPSTAVSLFQVNAIAMKVVRYLNWALGYTDAVSYMSLDLPAAGSPS